MDRGHLIFEAHLQQLIIGEKQYSSSLPSELEDAYCYTVDGGHSIIVAVKQFYLPEASPGDFLVPAPVKTVLRLGYEEKDGYIVCDLPYSSELGLLTDPEDDEF